MPEHFQLLTYELQDRGNGNLLVLFSRQRKYYDVLRHAFPEFRFSKCFPDVRERYNWGTYIYAIDENNRHRVRDLLDLLKRAVCLDDELTQTFALDYHKPS